MIDVYLTDMVGFFEEIAEKEWAGRSRWQSEFAELTIEAQSGPEDNVTLDIRGWWSHGDELDNERTCQLIVRSDVLPEFGQRLRELTGATGTGRLTG